jgi:hypothetical protein
MPVLNGFASGCRPADAFADFDRTDRGSRSLGELFPGLI